MRWGRLIRRHHSRVAGLVLVLLAGVSSSGCLQAGVDSALTGAGEVGRPVVVALLDTGINPYHQVFRLPPGEDADVWEATKTELASAGGGSPHRLDPTFLDSYDASREADADMWRSVRPYQLYSLSGTNILTISFHPTSDELILDNGAHGTGTAGIVTETAPGVIVVMVEVSATLCHFVGKTCVVDPEMVTAMEWVAEQPWIDIVSISLGIPGHHPTPELDLFALASKRAAQSGKLIVAGSGNHVAPPLLDGFSGPPWVITAGGATEPQGGEAVVAGKTPDVVANFTDRVARSRSTHEYAIEVGTSLAAPRVAGTLALTLQRISGQGIEGAPSGPRLSAARGGVEWSADNVRHALNASAMYWDYERWDPTRASANDTERQAFAASAPILTPAPFVQMGWGYVDASVADEMARRLLADDLGPPPEKAAAARYMGELHALREGYWAARAS